MIQIDKQLLRELYDKAVVNPRLRQNMDLRNSGEDYSQRMLNALMLGCSKSRKNPARFLTK